MVGNTGLRDPKKEAQKEETTATVATGHCAVGASAHGPGFWSTVKAAAWHVLTGGFRLGGEAEAPQEDDRSIVQLLLDQIEFADVVVLSKAHLVEKPESISEIRCLLQRLNPDAKVIVPMKELVRKSDYPTSSVYASL